MLPWRRTLDLVRLFLNGGVITNGFQSHVAHEESDDATCTLLCEGTVLGQCSIATGLLALAL